MDENRTAAIRVTLALLSAMGVYGPPLIKCELLRGVGRIEFARHVHRPTLKV
jgi:hypothetical protein